MKKANSSLPSDHHYRITTIPGWATRFRVPRYISRVDINTPFKAGTHGWQVRYKGQSKFFSDVHYGRKRIGSPAASLEAATIYLGSIFEGPPLLFREKPLKHKADKSLPVGVRERRKVSIGRKVTEILFEVSAVSNRHPSKLFYVGTENTLTPQRYQTALHEAIQYRMTCILEVKLEHKMKYAYPGVC